MDIQNSYSKLSAEYEKYREGNIDPNEKQLLQNKIKELTKEILNTKENYSQYKNYAANLVKMLETFSKADSELLEEGLNSSKLTEKPTPQESAITKSIQVTHDALLDDVLKYKGEKLKRLQKGDDLELRSIEKSTSLLLERVQQLREEILTAPATEVPESIIFSFNNLIGKEFGFEKIAFPKTLEKTVDSVAKNTFRDALSDISVSSREEVAQAATESTLAQFQEVAKKVLGPFYDEAISAHAYAQLTKFSPNAIDYTEFFEKSASSSLKEPLAVLWEKSKEAHRKNLSALLTDSLALTCFHPQEKTAEDIIYSDFAPAPSLPIGLPVFTFQEFTDLVKKMTPVGAPVRSLFVEWSDYTKLDMSQKIFTLLTAKMNSKSITLPKAFKENYQQLLQSSQLPLILFTTASFMTPEVFLNMGLAGVLNQELFSRFQSLPALFDLAGGMIAQIRADSSKLGADTSVIEREVDAVEEELGKITSSLLEKVGKGSLKEAELTSFLTSMNRCFQRLIAVSDVEHPFYASPKLLTGHTTASKLLAAAAGFLGRKTADSTPLTEIPYLKPLQESYFFEGAFFPETIDLSAKKQSSEEITQLWDKLVKTGGHAVKVRDGVTVHVRASLAVTEKVFLVMDPNSNQFKTYNLDAFQAYLNKGK